MNTDDTNITPDTSTPRPLGFWLKATDRLLAAEFARGFETEGVGRRTWRLLNAVDGTVPSRRPLTAGRLRDLCERGWVAHSGAGFTLTDEGRAAKQRLDEVVSGIRSRVTGAVSAEDLATTLATLEQISRAFGWTEEAGMPRGMRGRRGGRGFGHGRHGSGERSYRAEGVGRREGRRRRGPNFGPDGFDGRSPEGAGFGRGRSRGQGFGPDGFAGARCDHDDHHRRERFGRRGRGFDAASDSPFGPERGRRGGRRSGHPAMKIAAFGQRSYERGFEAGFAHGRDA